MENKIVLKNAKFVETTFEDGSKQLVGVVRGDGFAKINLPSEPNPRQFIGESNPNYKDMVKTLKTEPMMFTRKNSGGITIFASGCDHNGDGSYTLTFKKGDGIANGIHSYFAIKNHGTAKSQIRVTIEIGLNRDNTAQIANALNLSKKLQAYSLQNKDGSFDWHKTILQGKAAQVQYHEGDTGVVEVKEEMAFLNLFKYDKESKKLDILTNIERSEHANASFLNKIIKEHQDYNFQLRYIAKEVHDIMMYTILNENYATLLKPLKRTNGQNWLKTRSSQKRQGILKGLGLLLVAGLVTVGTTMNHNGIILWKEQYRDEKDRKHFIDELFKKVYDVISVEDGNASDIIRQESVRKKIIRHAKMVAARLDGEKAVKRKAG